MFETFPAFDEELARHDRIGTRIHQAIVSLAAETAAPTVSQLKAAADAQLADFRPIEARAHRQHIAAAVGTYFWRLLPPADWLFAGAEEHLGLGRVDLMWRRFDDAVLIDELKTGSPRRLELSATRRQIETYREAALVRWPGQFSGIRLLSTSDPRRSLFIDADGLISPLHSTPHVRST